jgi:hypothetical protein
MKNSKIRKLLIEQTLQQNYAEDTIERIKNYIRVYNELTPNQQAEIAENPDVGSIWFSEAEELMTVLANSLSPTDDYVQKNKDAIGKTIFEFKEILSQYPEVYEKTFKPYFDTVGVKSIEAKPNSTDTTTSTTSPLSSTATAPTSATAGTPTKGEYATGYTGVSIVDFLDQSGKPSDKASRAKLAVELGIVKKPEDYKFTAAQNTQMLNMLRSGQKQIATQPAQKLQPEDKPMSSVPSIKFGDMQFPPYVDMGGGRYVLATPEQVANPNLQLYIQNPKKGAGEYNKANFVKVRREKGGQEIRRQSQFGGAVGSASNLLGDIGNTLSKPFRK